jgi:HJR/Mrr/RecB family endonuclease
MTIAQNRAIHKAYVDGLRKSLPDIFPLGIDQLEYNQVIKAYLKLKAEPEKPRTPLGKIIRDAAPSYTRYALEKLNNHLHVSTREDGKRIVTLLEREIFKLNEGQITSSRIWFPCILEELIGVVAKKPELLRLMPSRKFEELIAGIFKNQGFEVELTPETRDGGYDILAVRNDKFLGPSTALIECKRYSKANKVSVEVPRALLGVAHSVKASKGLIVTTSEFTTPAKQFIEENKKILTGHDFSAVRDWIIEITK